VSIQPYVDAFTGKQVGSSSGSSSRVTSSGEESEGEGPAGASAPAVRSGGSAATEDGPNN